MLTTIRQNIYSVLRNFLKALQITLWNLWGINKLKEKYETSAQVCKILYRSKDFLEFSSIDDFLYIHSYCTHPDIVLKDNISLYCLTATQAVFVDCAQINVFDSKHHAFVYETQYLMAKNLIIMSLSSFYMTAQKIQKPKVPFIHVANHGRCGSTLLAKVFEAIPGALSVSEPNSFTGIARISGQKRLPRSELNKLMYGSIMFLCKHCNKRNSKLLFLKCQNVAVYVTDIMMDVAPWIFQIYMYREATPFIRSYEKLFALNSEWQLSAETCKFYSGIGFHDILGGYPVYSDEAVDSLHFVSKISLYWITGAAAFTRLIEKGYDIKSLKFEDFLRDPKKCIFRLFEDSKICSSLFPDVDKVMSKDSQAGTAWTSRKLNKQDFQFTEFTSEIKREVNKLCADFQVSCFWNNLQLEPKLT